MQKLLCLLVVCFLFSFVRCDGGHDGRPDDGIGGHQERDVDVNVGGNGIQITSQSRTDVANKVRIDIQVTGSGGSGGNGSGSSKSLSARLRAFSHATGSGANAVAHVDFKVKFQSLLEYQEVDGVDGFSGNDTAGKTIALGEETYSFQARPDLVTANNVIKVVTATSDHFKITAKVGGLLFNSSGVWTFTNSAKVDVDIINFPYSGALSNPRLALVVGVVSELTQFKAIQHDDTQPHADSDAVVVRSGGVQGAKNAFFSWVNTADVNVNTQDAATVSVVAGPLKPSTVDGDDDSSREDKKTIVYSFLSVQPTTVHWDPLVGVNTLSGVTAVMPTMVALVAMLLCVVFML